MSDDLTVGEILDGVALWDEHKPQSGEDWVAVAERFIAAGSTTEDSSALFAGLLLAVKQRDQAREAAIESGGCTCRWDYNDEGEDVICRPDPGCLVHREAS